MGYNRQHKDIEIAEWCDCQRWLHHKGLLGKREVKKMESLPDWDWNGSSIADLVGLKKTKKAVKK